MENYEVLRAFIRDVLRKLLYGELTLDEAENYFIDLIRRNQPTCTSVLQFTKNGEFIAEYFSINEAERCSGVSKSSICRCCKGKLKTAGKFIWKYKDT